MKTLKIFILLSVTFICLLFTLEIYSRFIVKQPSYAFPDGYFIDNQYYGYELAKNFKGSYSQPEFTVRIDTNSQGLRDTEYKEEDDGFRILALGDSFTFGIGVELGDTYLSLLEKMLNEDTGERKFQVIKAGIPGYSTYNERIFLENKGLNYRPNLVLIQFWWDDLGIDRITYLANTGFLTTGKITNFANFRLFLNKHFKSYAFLRRIATVNFKKSLFSRSQQIEAQNQNDLKNEFSVTLKEFRKMQDTCKNKNIDCLFILVPSKEFLPGKNINNESWNKLCDFLDKNGLKGQYIDLLPVLSRAREAGKDPFFRIDPHLNKIGHELVAREIYRYLKAHDNITRGKNK